MIKASESSPKHRPDSRGLKLVISSLLLARDLSETQTRFQGIETDTINFPSIVVIESETQTRFQGIETYESRNTCPRSFVKSETQTRFQGIET